jgi:hypothetical protein
MSLRSYPAIAELASLLVLGPLLEHVRDRWGGFDVVDHWQQGEFHHDTVVRVRDLDAALPGAVLVIATNCNGGVKEILCFAEPPERSALWHARCPDNPEFEGALPPLLASAKTAHWFDPAELLAPGARSEYREQFRERQSGGGWMQRKPSAAS